MNNDLRKFDITITYCVPCDYSDYALGLTKELIKNHQHNINKLTLATGSKGILDIRINNKLIFSKKDSGRYPEAGEISRMLTENYILN